MSYWKYPAAALGLIVGVMLAGLCRAETVLPMTDTQQTLLIVQKAIEYEKWIAGVPEADEGDASYFIGFCSGVCQFCGDAGVFVPHEVTDAQMTAVIVNYLKAHPERWNRPPALLVFDALAAAWPNAQPHEPFADHPRPVSR